MENFRIYVGDIVYFGDSKNMLCRVSPKKCELISMSNGNRFADVKFRIRNKYNIPEDYQMIPYIHASDINDNADFKFSVSRATNSDGMTYLSMKLKGV